MLIVLKSGSLNLLEPSGSLHARTGIALLLFLIRIPEAPLVHVTVSMYTETPTSPTAVPPLSRVILFASLHNCTDIFGWLQIYLFFPSILNQSDFKFNFLLNNQPDALTIPIYSVIKFYMFQASSLPIIRSFLLYIRHC